MNYGKVEELSLSRSRWSSTAKSAATSAILTVILSKSDRAPTSRTGNARLGWDRRHPRAQAAGGGPSRRGGPPHRRPGAGLCGPRGGQREAPEGTASELPRGRQRKRFPRQVPPLGER